MPNGGIEYYKDALSEIVNITNSRSQPVIVNIADFSNSDFKLLINLAERSGADYVELNLGCPNVWIRDEQKQIISYHPKLIKDLASMSGKALKPISLGVVKQLKDILPSNIEIIGCGC